MAKSKKEKEKEAKAKLVAEKVSEEAKEKAEQKSEEGNKEGFLNEITEKIREAQSMDDLEALQQRVYDIWGDSVPNEIQVLAAEKGQELTEKSNALAKSVEKKEETPSGWVKCSEKEAKEAEKAGTLAGYDAERGLALINKS